VANDGHEQDGISRRDFTARLGAATAGLAIGGDLLRPGLSAASQGRVLGANDRVVVASIGIRGQGNAVKRGFAQLPNVTVKTLCDIDANLAPERINDARLTSVPGYKPGFVQDMRRVFEDKEVDAVIVATPNHWHALATIWGLQAGKHVYVEKPASHTVWEGRKMVEAQARFGKIVQVGTMNRSRPAVLQAAALDRQVS
jgi:predicted dehydrogenase